MTAAQAAFLDRDGVLNALVLDRATGQPESPLEPEAVELLPGVGAALHRLRAAGYMLVCVTNQPAAAKGNASVADLVAVQLRVESLLADLGVRLDDVRMCTHHPHGVTPAFSEACGCRKPQPGMLLSAAEEFAIDLRTSWMIGDTDDDVRAGQAAGCRTILVENPDSAHKRSGTCVPDAVVCGLEDAVGIVVPALAKD